MKKNKSVIIRLILTAILYISICAIIYLIFDFFNLTNITKEQLRDFVDKTGVFGPLVYMIIVFLQVCIIPLPGMVVILAGNMLFGWLLTTLYCFIAMMLGAIFTFYLGRKLGRPFVNWVIKDKTLVNTYLSKVRGKEFVVFFFMFLLPIFPDDTLCAVAGITPLTYKEFIFMQLVSRPISIVTTLLFFSGEIIPFNTLNIIILTILGIICLFVFVYCYKNADKITDFFDKILFKRK